MIQSHTVRITANEDSLSPFLIDEVGRTGVSLVGTCGSSFWSSVDVARLPNRQELLAVPDEIVPPVEHAMMHGELLDSRGGISYRIGTNHEDSDIALPFPTQTEICASQLVGNSRTQFVAMRLHERQKDDAPTKLREGNALSKLIP